MYWDHGSYGYMMGAHVFGWLLWVGVLVAVLVFALTRRKRDPKPPRETPLDILKRRLASGELSPEDYEKRKALLDRDSAPH